jgi:heme A synthase
MSRIRNWWKNTNEMPFLLRMLCQGGMVASPILLVFAVLPVADWEVNDIPMSYRDLWISGAALSMISFIVLVGVGAWGLAARSSVSRWALVLAPLVPLLLLFALGDSSVFPHLRMTFAVFVQGAVTSLLIYACLFWLPSVRRYLDLPSAQERA